MLEPVSRRFFSCLKRFKKNRRKNRDCPNFVLEPVSRRLFSCLKQVQKKSDDCPIFLSGIIQLISCKSLDNTTFMMYIYGMEKNIIKYQRKALKALAGEIDDLYLAGGTALSLFYFQHRLSVDLDFFTQDFVYTDIARIAERLETTLKKKIVLVGQTLEGRSAKMVVYNIHFTATDTLKIDFVEDTVALLKKTKVVDGIRVLSLEDIYLRKLYALVGMVKVSDAAGRNKFIGGRADAKDFYDIYYLSYTFIPLSKFAIKYFDRTIMEAIIRWFRTFDRMAMMDGVLELVTDKSIDYKAMMKHFEIEIGKIISYEIGDL